jgi:hypothetical protein
MTHRRTANAIVSRQNIHFDEWMEELRNQHEGAVPKDHVHRIAKTVLRKCDPKQFLLSHATIVASVDAYAPKGATVGRRMNSGVQIDVRWTDYRIKPECNDIINNNGDAWERSLLLSTYRTFIGAHNYLEHIQLPELSKGFIVDAIARDLGKTCYVDILVATDRKHKQLITDILSGQIAAMSMGCISLFTICTACGNVAADDSQVCPCVQYVGKGQLAIDEDGMQFPIAELIGHVQVPNSNQFIEASWVRNPAFRGAVRRQILNPESSVVATKLSNANQIYEIRRGEININGLKKAASLKVAQGEQDQGGGQAQLPDTGAGEDIDLGGPPPDDAGADAGADAGGADTGEKPKEGVDELLEKAQEQILELLTKNLGEKLAPKPEDVGTAAPAPSVDVDNDNLMRASKEFDRKLVKTFPDNPRLVKWASSAHRIGMRGVDAIRASGMTSKDLIILSWIEDRVAARTNPPALYKTAMTVGSISNYPSQTSYLAACRMRMGRSLTNEEKAFLLRKGRIASLV